MSPEPEGRLQTLTALNERSVLAGDRLGTLSAVNPEIAAAGCLSGRKGLLAARADFLGARFAESSQAGRLTGAVLEVSTAEAASLNAFVQDVAWTPPRTALLGRTVCARSCNRFAS
ncbi:hypothetical protein [Streptomyces sp. NPDC004135]